MASLLKKLRSSKLNVYRSLDVTASQKTWLPLSFARKLTTKRAMIIFRRIASAEHHWWARWAVLGFYSRVAQIPQIVGDIEATSTAALVKTMCSGACSWQGISRKAGPVGSAEVYFRCCWINLAIYDYTETCVSKNGTPFHFAQT